MMVILFRYFKLYTIATCLCSCYYILGKYNNVIKDRNKNNTPHEEDLPYFRQDGAMPIKACMHGTAADVHSPVYTGLDRH